MTDRLTRHRWWLALAYCLSAVLAQGAHSHGGHDEETAHADVFSCSASSGCPETDEGMAVWLSLEVADCDSVGCPSCQFQLTHQATSSSPVRVVEFDASCISDPPSAPFTSTVVSRLHNRGPPRG